MRPTGFVLSAAVFCRFASAQAGTVTLVNDSHPWANLEPGDNFTLSIIGAAPYSEITIVESGGAPYDFGLTNEDGDWWVEGTYTAAYVGSYSEYWYVGGNSVPAYNLSYYTYAPTLPFFHIWPNYSGQNCPPTSTFPDYCTVSGGAMYWRSTPIAYASSSSVLSDSYMDLVADSWNNAQSKLSFEPSTEVLNVLAEDAPLAAGILGHTEVESEVCNSECYGEVDECTGECADSSMIYYSFIQLDSSQIAAAAPHYYLTAAGLATQVVIHELGHSIRLGHATETNRICSEVQSLMYPNEQLLLTCGVYGPTSCDVDEVDAIYPSVPYCAQGGDYCDGVSCE